MRVSLILTLLQIFVEMEGMDVDSETSAPCPTIITLQTPSSAQGGEFCESSEDIIDLCDSFSKLSFRDMNEVQMIDLESEIYRHREFAQPVSVASYSVETASSSGYDEDAWMAVEESIIKVIPAELTIVDDGMDISEESTALTPLDVMSKPNGASVCDHPKEPEPYLWTPDESSLAKDHLRQHMAQQPIPTLSTRQSHTPPETILLRPMPCGPQRQTVPEVSCHVVSSILQILICIW